MSTTKSVNVWLGSEIGILKAVNLVGKTATNYFDQKRIGKANEILSTCWSRDKKNIFCGFKRGTVRNFNIDSGQFTEDPAPIPDFKIGSEDLVKIQSKDDVLMSCTSSGNVTLWDPINDCNEKVKFQTNVGPHIYDLALCEDESSFATGGKENTLKIFDLENPSEPVFKAKNVPHDWLQLRVPVWVTGIKYLKESKTKIVTTTGTSKIRLYDITGERRRPCLEMNFDKYPLTCLTLTNNANQVIVANTRGNVGMFDFRKKALVRVFKGFAGSVRSMETHPNLDYVASCGLDRFLRIHNINSGKLEYKVYLKARLNSVLFSDLDFVEEKRKMEKGDIETDRKRKLEESDDEEDPVWRRMKTADESSDSDGEQ